MSAYLFIKTKIHDPEEYAKYVTEVNKLAAGWNCRWLVRSQPVELLEGSSAEWGDHFLLVSEWPSVDEARRFWTSTEYRRVRALRVNAGDVHVMLTESLR